MLAAVLLTGGGSIARSPLAVAGGALLLAAGIGTAWGMNRGRPRGRAWAWRGATAVGAFLGLFLLVYPSLLAIDYLAKPRRAIDPAALRLPHRDVSFPAADGVRLSGWYVPGTNGAAIVLVHGGGGDARGRSAMPGCLPPPATASCSTTHADAVRAPGTRMRSAGGGIATCAARSTSRGLGVRRIGLLGLSTGAEAVVTEAASDPRVAAVVADGLQGRTPGDASHLSFGNRISIQPAFAVLSAEIRAVRGERQPAPLLDLVHRLAATRPLLLIGTESFERELDRGYVRGTAAGLWELPGTAHTQGLATHPRAYAARVLAVFDSALRPR